MIDISIIIPIYNNYNYFKECLDSISTQTLKNIEVIVVDDCSKVENFRIINDIVLFYENIKIINLKKHVGAGAARNYAVKQAEGEYIFFLDSDDYLQNNKVLEDTFKKAEKKQLDVLVFRHEILIDNRTISQNEWFWKNEVLEDGNIYSLKDINDVLLIPAYPWNKLYNRNFLINNNIQCSETFCHNDIAMSINSLIAARVIGFLPKSMVVHRMDDEDYRLSNHDSIKRFDLFEAFNDVDEFIKKYEISYEIKTYLLMFKYQTYVWGLNRIDEKLRSEYIRSFGSVLKKEKMIIWIYFLNKFIKSTKEKFKLIAIKKIPGIYILIKNSKRK